MAKQIKPDRYYSLFARQMLFHPDMPPEDVSKWIERYHELTGLDFLSSVCSFQDVFTFLVDKDYIDLWSYFSAYRNNKDETGRRPCAEIYLINSYISEFQTKKAFDFCKKLFSTYSLNEMHDSFGSCFNLEDVFLREKSCGSYGTTTNLKLKRDFLSKEEERQLLEWLDASIYYNSPERYFPFLIIMLKDEYIRELYDKEELSAVLKALIVAGEQGATIETLKKELFSESDKQSDKELKEQKKLAKEQEESARLSQKLVDAYDGSIKSLLNYVGEFRWQVAQESSAAALAVPYLEDALKKTRDLDTNSFVDLLSLCGKMVRLKVLAKEKAYEMIRIAMKKED